MTARTTLGGNTVKGVDVGRLVGNVEAITARPELARFPFRVRNRWIDGGLNRSEIQDFYGVGQEDTSRVKPFVLDNDEPDVLLGSDRGANPVENVLHALAGCITTSLVYHLAARGIRVDSVESELEGDLDLRGFLGLSGAQRRGYEAIRVRFRVQGDGVTEELLQELYQLSPVLDIGSNPVPVYVTFAIEP